MPRRPLLAGLLALLLAPPAAAGPVGQPVDVARGLTAPWEVAFPDATRTWVTERNCRVREVDTDDRDGATGAVRTIFPPAARSGCRKFLGLVTHPGFAQNRLVYLYETTAAESRVLRLRDVGDRLVEEAVVFSSIGTDGSHDGGRMRFGPDGHLYVTTGDVHDPARPRDVQSLNGKVLRLAVPGGPGDGQPAPGNPFLDRGGNARYVFSLGHRHPQGLAFDGAGRLWETEHGPSGEAHAPAGAKCCRDEVNLIVAGGDYGWPTVAGSQRLAGTIPPAALAPETPQPVTWAPGGAAIGTDGALYVPMLAGRHLRRFAVSCSGLGAQTAYLEGGDRLRTVTVGRGALWFTTDDVETPEGAADERLKRWTLDSEGFAGLTCAAPAGPTPTPPAPAAAAPSGAAGSPAAAPSGTPGAPTAGAATASRLAVLLGRARDALRRQGLRRMARRGGVVVRAGGFAPGTLRVRVTLRHAGGRTTPLALRVQRVRGSGTQTVRLVASRTGRAALRRAPRQPSIGLLARHTPAAGPAVERALRARVRR